METKDRGKTLEGLKLAIQMEIDGKEYYLEASKKSNKHTTTCKPVWKATKICVLEGK